MNRNSLPASTLQSITEGLSGGWGWEVKVQPVRVFKWFIDACQRGTRVWLITTDAQYAERMASRWRCCSLLTRSISYLSSQQSKWMKGLKSRGMLQRCEAKLHIRKMDSFAILRLLPSAGQKFKVKRVYFVAMDTTSSKLLSHYPSFNPNVTQM